MIFHRFEPFFLRIFSRSKLWLLLVVVLALVGGGCVAWVFAKNACRFVDWCLCV
jgi:hypothetical protein